MPFHKPAMAVLPVPGTAKPTATHLAADTQLTAINSVSASPAGTGTLIGVHDLPL